MKYIFIINSLGESHWRNRVDEFVSHGYDVVLYAYSRNGAANSYHYQYKVEVLADFPNTLPYSKRLGIYYNTLRQVIKKHKSEDVCYYFFGLDTAMVAFPFIKQPFIYEEFDLVHTYVGNPWVKKALENIDQRIIRKSLLTIFTSEGFMDFHFGRKRPNNICLVPNKLSPSVVDVPQVVKQPLDIDHIKFGFVGAPRYRYIANFASVIAERFPQHEMHFYGRIGLEDEHLFTELQKNAKNVFFHGYFKNPDDLPTIYSKIDILLSTYDTDFENVRYAEPNKIYESLYFETPIIVSSGTFLAEKVERLEIGWNVDAIDDEEVVKFIKGLTVETIKEKSTKASQIEKKEALNVNEDLFERIKQCKTTD